jgi:hypothetical protein
MLKKKKEKCICNAIIKSITTYGCEVRQNKKKEKMLALKINFWRRSARISRREEI